MVVEELDDAIFVFELFQEFNLAFVAHDCTLISVAELDPFEREHFRIFGHDLVHI
jgi:hypothetical protein